MWMLECWPCESSMPTSKNITVNQHSSALRRSSVLASYLSSWSACTGTKAHYTHFKSALPYTKTVLGSKRCKSFLTNYDMYDINCIMHNSVRVPHTWCAHTHTCTHTCTGTIRRFLENFGEEIDLVVFVPLDGTNEVIRLFVLPLWCGYVTAWGIHQFRFYETFLWYTSWRCCWILL